MRAFHAQTADGGEESAALTENSPGFNFAAAGRVPGFAGARDGERAFADAAARHYPYPLFCPLGMLSFFKQGIDLPAGNCEKVV